VSDHESAIDSGIRSAIKPGCIDAKGKSQLIKISTLAGLGIKEESNTCKYPKPF